MRRSLQQTSGVFHRTIVSRIDGNSEGATLLKTSMGEKETVICGLPTVLLPASGYSQEKQNEKPRRTRYETVVARVMHDIHCLWVRQHVFHS